MTATWSTTWSVRSIRCLGTRRDVGRWPECPASGDDGTATGESLALSDVGPGPAVAHQEHAHRHERMPGQRGGLNGSAQQFLI
jgi:hypothetical protein